MFTTEIDFPRGGSVIKNKQSVKRKSVLFNSTPSLNDSSLNKDKKLLNDDSLNNNEKDKENIISDKEYENVFRQNINLDLINTNIRGLGFVKKINDIDVILEGVDGILFKLLATQISKIFSKTLESENKTLDDIFQIGQAIAFKVTKSSFTQTNKRKSRPEVTTCPYIVNEHLHPHNLSAGLVLNGIVISIEEKGAIIDFGFTSNITGFVKADDLPEYLSLEKLCIGQVILLRVKIEPNALTRVISVSAFVEVEAIDDECLTLNSLMPGTVVVGHPEKVTKSGIFIALKNDVKIFIRNIYLPPRLRSINLNVIPKSIRACVLLCQQNSPLLALSAHPEILSISKIEKRLLAEKYKIGNRINCKLYEIDKQQNLYFWLEEDENGKVPHIAAKAFRSKIDDFEKNASKFTIDSVHICRIIGYHLVERLLIVSLNSDIIKQKIVGASDASPGERFLVKILSVKPNGIKVELFKGVYGYITPLHVKNKPTKLWEKGFRKDQKIYCRILFIDELKNKIFLTAKSALVESDEKQITQINENLIGEYATGTIIKILNTGGLVIGFYNKIVGLIQAHNAKALTNIFIGMPLKVRVKKVNIEQNQLILDFGNEIINNVLTNKTETKKNVLIKEKKKIIAKPFKIYKAKVVGKWGYGGTSPETSAELLLNGGTIGRLHASELNLTDCVNGSKPMEIFLEKNIEKTINVKVICVGNTKTISKNGKKILLKNFNTSRFVECTLNSAKLSEPKKKLKLINYKTKFNYGIIIPSFCVFNQESDNASLNGYLTSEINPLFKAMIKFSDDVKQLKLENGALFFGTVQGINNTNRSKCIVLSYGIKIKVENDDEKDLKKLKKNTEIVGNRKRTLSSSSSSTKTTTTGKTKKTTITTTSLNNEALNFVTLPDPGFDWSLSGFNLNDLTSVFTKNNEFYEPKNKRKCSEKDENYVSVLESINTEFLEESDYKQLIANNPNKSEPWIKCIAYFISKKNYEKSKLVAEQALKTINFKNDKDLFNIWVVYLNLEVLFGNEQTIKELFERACAATNSLQMHKQMIKILKNCNKTDEITEIFESMLKKFRHNDLEVWYYYGQHLLENGQVEKARELLQKAMQSLDKKHHLKILCRFAQLEFKFGDGQRGKTMLEKIVHSYSKKIFVWNIFIDLILKYENIIEARKIFERALDANNSDEKKKQLLKKWIEVEEKFGDLESQNLVRERASKLAEFLKEKVNNESVEKK